uniref:Uncharacterized protein n=1 Tax=Glossina pallidipes TaxID=7398 RepID=A0A1B0AGX0_GLOPL
MILGDINFFYGVEANLEPNSLEELSLNVPLDLLNVNLNLVLWLKFLMIISGAIMFCNYQRFPIFCNPFITHTARQGVTVNDVQADEMIQKPDFSNTSEQQSEATNVGIDCVSKWIDLIVRNPYPKPSCQPTPCRVVVNDDFWNISRSMLGEERQDDQHIKQRQHFRYIIVKNNIGARYRNRKRTCKILMK